MEEGEGYRSCWRRGWSRGYGYVMVKRSACNRFFCGVSTLGLLERWRLEYHRLTWSVDFSFEDGGGQQNYNKGSCLAEWRYANGRMVGIGMRKSRTYPTLDDTFKNQVNNQTRVGQSVHENTTCTAEDYFYLDF